MHTKINAVDSSNDHLAKSVYRITSDAVSEVTGWNVDLVSRLEGPNGTGITLEMNDMVDKQVRDAPFRFYLQKELEGHFGESTGSANVTAMRLKKNLNIREVIEFLHETGQLEKPLRIIEEFRYPEDPDAKVILTYALAQYAKGWLAEELISQKVDGFKKGSVSQDEGGIDGYLHGEPVQIGSITRYNSAKKELESKEVKQLLYQWDDSGNLHLADMDEILGVNKQIAKDAENVTSATLIRKSVGNVKAAKEFGRSFRYLWW
jgi:hypothetical protein